MAHYFEKAAFFFDSEKARKNINDGLLKGSIYAVKVQSAPLRLMVITRALLENLARDIRCVVITSISAEKLIFHLNGENLQRLIKAISDGKLMFISPIGDYRKNIFRYGPKRFLAELEKFSSQGNNFFIFDQAETLFTVDDKEVLQSQVQSYVEWMRSRKNIGLFLLPDTSDFDTRGPYFQPMANHFNGIAGLYMFRNKIEIGVDFWTTQAGIILSRPMEVDMKDDGLIGMQLSLAVNRRDRNRSLHSNPGNESDTVAEEKIPDTEKAAEFDIENRNTCLATIVGSAKLADALPMHSYSAPAASRASPAANAGVPGKRRWKAYAQRIALLGAGSVALGALVVSVKYANFKPIGMGFTSLFQSLAMAAPRSGAPEVDAGLHQAPHKTVSMPKAAAASLPLTAASARTESFAADPVRATMDKRKNDKNDAASTQQADRAGDARTEGLPQVSGSAKCPAALQALELCASASQQ
jgi:hypothetical protein